MPLVQIKTIILLPIAFSFLLSCGNITLNKNDGDIAVADTDQSPQNDDALIVVDEDAFIPPQDEDTVAVDTKPDEMTDTMDDDTVIDEDVSPDLDEPEPLDESPDILPDEQNDEATDEAVDESTDIAADEIVDEMSDTIPDETADTLTDSDENADTTLSDADITPPLGDTDGDGISDEEEALFGTDPAKKDTDDDGDEDLAEVVYGSNPTDPDSSIPADKVYVVLPYNAPRNITLPFEFEATIEAIDVAVLLDMSGSMEEETTAIKNDATTALIGEIAAHVADPGFGLATFEWNPPYTMSRKITGDTTAAGIAFGQLGAADGDDEYGWLALYLLSSGSALSGTVELCFPGFGGCNQTFVPDSVFSYPVANCSFAEGSIGGACFRDHAMPIFVMITDEAFVNCPAIGQDGTNDTCRWSIGSPTNRTQAISAMKAIGAKFIGIDTGFVDTGAVSEYAKADLVDIAEQTRSLGNNGKPYVYHSAQTDGSDLASLIAAAVINLTASLDKDITLDKRSSDQCADITAAEFVSRISTTGAIPTNGIAGYDLTTYFSVTSGTLLNFEVGFHNLFCHNQGTEPLVFEVLLPLLANGAPMAYRTVTVIVPTVDYACPDDDPLCQDIAICGNGIIEDGELCETGDATLCDELGPLQWKALGDAPCNDDCNGYDTRRCVDIELHTCQEIHECVGVCSPGNTSCVSACRQYGFANALNTLDAMIACHEEECGSIDNGCYDLKCPFLTDACKTHATCGNGTIDGLETCEQGNAIDCGLVDPEKYDTEQAIAPCNANCGRWNTAGCFGFCSCSEVKACVEQACGGQETDDADCIDNCKSQGSKEGKEGYTAWRNLILACCIDNGGSQTCGFASTECVAKANQDIVCSSTDNPNCAY